MTAPTRNLGLAGEVAGSVSSSLFRSRSRTGLALSNRWIIVSASEADNGRDFNGDGDLSLDDWERVLFAHDLEEGETHELGVSSSSPAFSGEPVQLSEGWLLYQDQGELHLRDLDEGEDRNLGIAATGVEYWLSYPWVVVVREHTPEASDEPGNLVYDVRSGQSRALDLSLSCWLDCVLVSGGALVARVHDEVQGEVSVIHDLETGVTREMGVSMVKRFNTRHFGGGFPIETFSNFALTRDKFWFFSDDDENPFSGGERPYVHDRERGETTPLPFSFTAGFVVSGERLVFSSYDSNERRTSYHVFALHQFAR